MTITAAQLLKMVEAELVVLKDARVVSHARTLLVSPNPVIRGWDYGADDEAYLYAPCRYFLKSKPLKGLLRMAERSTWLDRQQSNSTTI